MRSAAPLNRSTKPIDTPHCTRHARRFASRQSMRSYSGGGYLILQLLIEEVSHESFNDYMVHAVLRPLGMTESTFVNPDEAHLADFYDVDGSKARASKFTALAAASLFTSIADMTRFLEAQLPGPAGALPGRGVLKPATLESMRVPQGYLYGIPIWGLGEFCMFPTVPAATSSAMTATTTRRSIPQFA